MLLLFALFYCQEQSADMHQTNKKLLLGTWLLKDIGIAFQREGIWCTPHFLKTANICLPFENLTYKVLQSCDGNLQACICTETRGLCKMSDITGNARCQLFKAGHLGRAFPFPPHISQTSALSLRSCHLDSVVRGNSTHQSQPATQIQTRG